MLWAKVVGRIKTQFMFNKFVFENHTFYDIMWKNFVGPDRLQMTAWHTRIAC